MLAPGGVFLQVTFAQPHFRRAHLSQAPGRWASMAAGKVDAGLGYTLWTLVKA